MYLKEATFFVIYNSLINQLEKLYSSKFMKKLYPDALEHLKKAHEELNKAEKIVKERKKNI